MVEVSQSIGLPLDGSVDERLARAISCHNGATALALQAGILLLSVKEETPHGEFGKLIESRGFDSKHAYTLMRSAEFFARLAPEDQKRVFTIGKSKVLMLANADPEVVEAALEDGDFDVETLSVRAMRARIKELERDRANIQSKLNTAEMRLDRLSKEASPVSPAYSAETEAFRAECVARTYEIELATLRLATLASGTLNECTGDAENTVRIDQVWTAIAVSLSRLAHLAETVRDAAALDGTPLPERVTGTVCLTPEEASRWLHDAKLIEARRAAEEAERYGTIAPARGRGRPRKGETK
ncbi:MAG: hypothetical protein LBU45_02240 [Azoarcus sp.]|nr:hypothetical protein [Azoarcus sp.]